MTHLDEHDGLQTREQMLAGLTVPTVAAQQFGLDEKALAAKAWADLEFAASATGALEVARVTLPIEKVRALVNERSALPSSPVSDLVEALMEWSKPDTGSHDAGVQLVCEQAASTLTTLSTRNAELEREVKRLRDVNQWQPIETAPKDGTEIIARRSRRFIAFSCWWQDGEWLHYDHDDGLISYRPNEWMPFPAALPTSPQGGEHE